jgi:DNA-binding CsgD family transcriptional regulator
VSPSHELGNSRNWRKSLGMNQGESLTVWERLYQRYVVKEVSAKRIAVMMGVSRKSVRRYLQRCGIPIRTSSEARCTLPVRRVRSGLQSNFWRGGVSKNHRTQGFTKSLRNKIRMRDGNRCVVCGTNVNLVVHHRGFDGDDHREDNLVTLCRSCHSWVHTHHCIVTILNGGRPWI